MKTLLIALLILAGSMLYAQNGVVFNKGMITIGRGDSGSIFIDASMLRQNLNAGYTLESIKGGGDKLLIVCEISTYPTMADGNGQYFSLTFHKAEFSPRDRKEALVKAGDLAFWGEMKIVGTTIEFVVRKLYGVNTIMGQMVIRVNRLGGLPVNLN